MKHYTVNRIANLGNGQVLDVPFTYVNIEELISKISNYALAGDKVRIDKLGTFYKDGDSWVIIDLNDNFYFYHNGITYIDQIRRALETGKVTKRLW